MYHKLILIILLVFFFTSCSKDNDITFDSENKDPFILYQDAYKAFEVGDYFYANKKFSEAELNF